MQEAVIIAGLESRHGAEDFERAKAMLTERGVNIIEAHPEPRKKAVVKRVKQAVKSGHKLICVVGGDGAQTAVCGLFAHKDAVLAVIPAGTGNSFAMSLGINDFEGAIDAVVNGKVAKVDLGKAGDIYFANFATVGLTSEIGEETPKGLKRIIGPIAYGVAGIGPMITHKPFRSRVSWKGNKLDLETHQMIIVSGRFYGHQPIAPHATLTDGKLSFFSTSGISHLELVRTYLSLIRGDQLRLPDAHSFAAKKITIKAKRGDQLRLPDAHSFAAKKITIKAKPRQLVAVDGSALCKTPITFSIDHRALRVMVPQDFPESKQ